jgi:SAM-dependent methyltransferase
MNNKKQRDLFLNSEGDAFFERNKNKSLKSTLGNDIHPLCDLISGLPFNKNEKINILEIGCGKGEKLSYLKENLNCNVFGIDPSSKAIKFALEQGISAQIGTAEKLPFKENSMDLIIFGFCLYLCDKTELFQISNEADRVLKDASWLAIIDFWSENDYEVPYKHLEGIKSHKCNFSKMFTWHPSYIIYDHKLRCHENYNYTDLSNNWIGLTIIRKNNFKIREDQ